MTDENTLEDILARYKESNRLGDIASGIDDSRSQIRNKSRADACEEAYSVMVEDNVIDSSAVPNAGELSWNDEEDGGHRGRILRALEGKRLDNYESAMNDLYAKREKVAAELSHKVIDQLAAHPEIRKRAGAGYEALLKMIAEYESTKGLLDKIGDIRAQYAEAGEPFGMNEVLSLLDKEDREVVLSGTVKNAKLNAEKKYKDKTWKRQKLAIESAMMAARTGDVSADEAIKGVKYLVDRKKEQVRVYQERTGVDKYDMVKGVMKNLITGSEDEANMALQLISAGYDAVNSSE